jgi:hypothetical protein
LLEASVLTPLLLSVVLGVYEFSWYFYQQQQIEAGVRDAARYMARVPQPLSGFTPCTEVDSSGNTYASYAQNIAAFGNTAGTGIARVSGWLPAKVIITCAESPVGNYADGTTTMTIIYVTTSFTDPTLGLFGFLGLAAPSISVTHQERFIGPG